MTIDGLDVGIGIKESASLLRLSSHQVEDLVQVERLKPRLERSRSRRFPHPEPPGGPLALHRDVRPDPCRSSLGDGASSSPSPASDERRRVVGFGDDERPQLVRPPASAHVLEAAAADTRAFANATGVACKHPTCELAARPRRRQPPAASKLEERRNNVTGDGQIDTGELLITPHRCKCRTCPSCSKAMGTLLRTRLHGMAHLFQQPALLSLTVDRDGHTVPSNAAHRGGFTSPKDAHRYVTHMKFIPRLMKQLGVKTWFWVLEFQTKTGDGWPHWHVLVDLASCPGGKLDLHRAWRIWRDSWGIGGLKLSPPDKLLTPGHAINYATKCLIEEPAGGSPEWVLKSNRAIRFVQGCRGLGPLVSDSAGKAKNAAEVQRKKAPASRTVRPLLERMSECGQSSRVWAECVDKNTGGVSLRLAGWLPGAADELVTLCGELGLRTTTTTDELGRTSRRVLRTCYEGLRAGLRRLCPGAWSKHRERVSQVRQLILQRNRFVRRRAWRQRGDHRRGAEVTAVSSYGD